MNPPADCILKAADRILVFSEERDSAKLKAASETPSKTTVVPKAVNEQPTDVMIIGYNENLPAIIRELPENVAHVYLAADNIPQEERDALALQATERGLELIDHHGDVNPKKGCLSWQRWPGISLYSL